LHHNDEQKRVNIALDSKLKRPVNTYTFISERTGEVTKVTESILKYGIARTSDEHTLWKVAVSGHGFPMTYQNGSFSVYVNDLNLWSYFPVSLLEKNAHKSLEELKLHGPIQTTFQPQSQVLYEGDKNVRLNDELLITSVNRPNRKGELQVCYQTPSTPVGPKYFLQFEGESAVITKGDYTWDEAECRIVYSDENEIKLIGYSKLLTENPDVWTFREKQ
ncbi:MAG: hypothetical protein ACRC5C_02055, partial [Bacilli bacterium]